MKKKVIQFGKYGVALYVRSFRKMKRLYTPTIAFWWVEKEDAVFDIELKILFYGIGCTFLQKDFGKRK